MNDYNLHTLIQRYEENYDFFNDNANDEKFKWKAVQHFRNVWFSDKKFGDFASLFKEAKKESSVLLDNSVVAPTNGIVKLAEIYPKEVEHLFRDTLFAPDGGDIDLKQDHLDGFVFEIEKLRQKSFPQSYKFKQDRHAASCYLSFFDPEHNYMYRYSEAEEMAQNIEFGFDIGSGESFSLKNYFKLCDSIVEALKQHTTLLEKYYQKIDLPEYYHDESLHLMAFDLMYCCRNYNLYDGLTHISKQESIKAYKIEMQKAKEEEERLAKIEKIEKEIRDLELSIDVFKDISLLDVEITHFRYGKGTVVSQNVNDIIVRFDDGTEKRFIIHKSNTLRPRFENDEETVNAFTEYADKMKRIDDLKKEKDRLQ